MVTFFINYITCKKYIINIRLVCESQQHKCSTVINEVHINLFYFDIKPFPAIMSFCF